MNSELHTIDNVHISKSQGVSQAHLDSSSDEHETSFLSARSTEEPLAMRLDAAPFDPNAIFQSENLSGNEEKFSDPTDLKKDDDSETQKQAKQQLQ